MVSSLSVSHSGNEAAQSATHRRHPPSPWWSRESSIWCSWTSKSGQTSSSGGSAVVPTTSLIRDSVSRRRPRPHPRAEHRCGGVPSPGVEQAESMRHSRSESSRSGTAHPGMRTPSRGRRGRLRWRSPVPGVATKHPAELRLVELRPVLQPRPPKEATTVAIDRANMPWPRTSHWRSTSRKRSSASGLSSRGRKRVTSGSSWSATKLVDVGRCKGAYKEPLGLDHHARESDAVGGR
jgi:hypothetical protein